MKNNVFNTSRGPAYDQEVDNEENSTIPSTIVIVNCFLNFPLMLISIFGNSLVLAAVIKTPSLRSPSIILLCGLAASDLVVGLIVQPLFIAKELKPFHFPRQLTKILSVTFCGISFATMSAISLDRFLALRYHMTYTSLNTTSYAKFTLISIWLVNSLLFSGVHIWYKSEQFYISYGLVGVYIIISTIMYLSNCSTSPIRDSHSTSNNGSSEYMYSNYIKRAGVNTHRCQHFRILRLYSFLLFTMDHISAFLQ